jgi:hypothetical protein
MSLFHRSGHIAKNIIVSLDFDGVLAHGLRIKKFYAKKWFGMDLSLSQTKKSGFEDLAKHLGKKDINYRSLMDPLNERHIMEYEIPHNCISVLKKLYGEGFRFVIITSRNDHDYPYAVKFVKHTFGGLIKYVHNTREEPKNAFVRHLHPRIHLDDGLKKLKELVGEAISLFYYRQPENSHENLSFGTTRIKEIHRWDEFYGFCHELKALHEAVCWKFDLENDYRHNTQIVRLLEHMSGHDKQHLLEEYASFKKKKAA